jgi:hypothetical protein
MHKKRNRSRPAEPFEVRLQRFADDTRAKALAMPSGSEREALLRKVEQTENVLVVSGSLGRSGARQRIESRSASCRVPR